MLKISHLQLSLLGLILLLSAPLAMSQAEKFGKIDPKWFAMKTYNQDTSAAAVILFDVGKTYFNYTEGRDLYLSQERHTRIKILKKGGYEKANIEIPFVVLSSNSRVDIQKIKAVSYNMENGKVVETELQKKDIFEESKTKIVKFKKFSIPNVKEGSIIEFSYRIDSDYDDILDWVFQDDIPVIWSEYTAEIPEFYHYKIFPMMQVDFAVSKKDASSMSIGTTGMSSTKYHWVVKDAPAFKNESFITTPKDHITKVEFQLEATNFQGIYKPYLNTWEKLAGSLMEDEDFGKQLNKRGLIKEVVAELTANITEPEKKLQKIYDYIRTNIKWDETNRYYADNNVKKVLEKKTGNSAEINFLLISMLREAGLNEVYPVILSTRQNGKLNPFIPRRDRINYVVAYTKMGGKEYFLDATNPLLPMGLLPFKALNWQGKLITDKVISWIDLYPKVANTQFNSVTLKFDEKSNLVGDLSVFFKDYGALAAREEMAESDDKKAKEKKEKESERNFTVKEYKFENLKDVDLPLKANYKIEVETQATGDKIYIEPFLVKSFKENPFKQEKRNFPVDFGHPILYSYNLIINLPADYDIEELPKSATYMIPDKTASFSYVVGKSGNMVQLRSKLSIDKPVYDPEEYLYLREFFTQLIAKQNEQIILKKITKP